MSARYPNILATKEWLLSDEYEKTIDRKLYDGKDDFQRIGAWRWEGIHDNKELVISHIFDQNQVGIDFGGYMGPIGGFTKIIDPAIDTWLDDIEDNSLDYVFTSHCLEHIKTIKAQVRMMYEKIKNGGKLIILVPSYKKEVWRAYYAPDHIHTFMLVGDSLQHYHSPSDAKYKEDLLEIDTILINEGFKIIIAKHVRKWCIFIYGEKNEKSM